MTVHPLGFFIAGSLSLLFGCRDFPSTEEMSVSDPKTQVIELPTILECLAQLQTSERKNAIGDAA